MTDVMTVVFLVALTFLSHTSASPYGIAQSRRGVSQNKTRGWPDLFLSYPEYPIRRRECSYKGEEYADGAAVDTREPCLRCRCMGGSMVCYLRVCPSLPDPPPAHCVLLLRKGACCTELICEDGGVSTNHISRAEPSGGDQQLQTISFGGGRGCIDNGTLYGSGSAMSTSSLCEYCYCIAGQQRCVRPRCLLPLTGCKPRRSPHSCCPVRYDCERHSTTTTLAPSMMKGCDVNGKMYPEGERVVGATLSPCDNCFCMRGTVRCVPLSCAPPLLGCTPIVEPGKCCASSYDCSKKTTTKKVIDNILHVSESSIDENRDQEVIINERSFPDDTLLTPSQIAAMLMIAEGRNNRRIGIENQINSTDEKPNSPIVNTSTTTEKLTTLLKEFVDAFVNSTQSADTITPVSTSMSSISNAASEVNKTNTIKSNLTEKITTESPTTKQVNLSDILPTEENKLEEKNVDINENSTTLSIITTESSIEITKMINDTVNCTTELSYFDAVANVTEYSTDAALVTDSKYNDTEERHPYISGGIDAIGDSNDDNPKHDSEKETNKENDISNIASQFPSTSLIIPKDDDIFMVNVSTFVRTNTSIVTLRPVAAISPEITINKNNQKDDYFDYDYKSSLPPSLPNLEIIPFLAIDAVDKVKDQNPYGTAYPQIESKNYIAGDNFNPTTFSSYAEDKYPPNLTSYPPLRSNNNFNRNPVYKQHINDKFQVTTYATIADDKYERHQYAQDKYDATVYPSLTVEDLQTESPSFTFEASKMNHFSPPSKTEGGFLPKDPSLVNPYYDLRYPTSDEISVTESSLMVTNQAKTNTDDCISNGRKYKNGELITESSACVVCFCYYGDIHCQDPECPPIKPGCRRITEKGALSCCGIEICNDETTVKLESTTPLIEKFTKTTKITSSPEEITAVVNPFKDVLKTEAAPNLESLIGDMIPHYIRKTTVSTSTTQAPPQEHTITKIPTFVVPSKVVKTPTTSPKSTTDFTTSVFSKNNENIPEKLSTESNFKYIPTERTTHQQQPTTTTTTTTVSQPIETTSEETEQFTDDDDSLFGSVLKLLLGDSSEEETPPPTTFRTTRRYTTTTTQVPSSWRPSTSLPSRLETTTTQPTTTKTTATTTASPSTTYRNTYKYAYTKPIRAVSSIPLIYKNNTKPLSTRIPSVYPTVNRFTKLRYPVSSVFTPPTPQTTKRILATIVPSKDLPATYKRKPPTESAFPFGAGLLKLAGCNIYGRMYRVGKIITELSNPCLECMCTEIGVQCRPIAC